MPEAGEQALEDWPAFSIEEANPQVTAERGKVAPICCHSFPLQYPKWAKPDGHMGGTLPLPQTTIIYLGLPQRVFSIEISKDHYKMNRQQHYL